MNRVHQLLRLMPALTVTLAAVTQVAVADMRVAEKAYELDRSQIVTLPSPGATRLAVRKCASCAADVLSINGATRYFVRPSKAALPLSDWLVADAAIAEDEKLYYVFYRPGDRVVTRIVLDAG